MGRVQIVLKTRNPPCHPFFSLWSVLLGTVLFKSGSLLNLGTKCSEVSVCISQGLDFKTPGLGFSRNWTLNPPLDLYPQ